MSKSLSSKALRPASGDADVVIVGAGLAGLFTALKLAPMPVTVVAAAPIGAGASSAWAQGGIAAAVGEGDTPEAHARDTIAAGAGLVDPDIARLVTREAAVRVEDLLRYGVPFDKDLEGKLALSREAAHTARRVVRVKGDQAGASIMAALIAAVRSTPSIRVLENVEAHELVRSDNGVTGVRITSSGTNRSSHRKRAINAGAVVLTTGGIGHLYAVTTNPPQARGDGLAMAARAGAVIADAEFIQFHPTAVKADLDPAPLASEALRGEGAVLVNARGERFMQQVHEAGELGPRDVVARAVHREIAAGRGAFLDCREAIGDRFADFFPTVFAKCTHAGIDPRTQPIPIAPAAHYHMGGILTDSRGRTTVDNLWACGEVASTGLHGANRLASNSLIEAVVFAARIADDISGLMHVRRRAATPLPDWTLTGKANGKTSRLEQRAAISELRESMALNIGVVRTAEGMKSTLETIARLEAKAAPRSALANMLLTAKIITVAAIEREESRGAHFRAEFPNAHGHLAKRNFITHKLANELVQSYLSEERKQASASSNIAVLTP